eukprot:3421375-Amphidinium_carterae.1
MALFNKAAHHPSSSLLADTVFSRCCLSFLICHDQTPHIPRINFTPPPNVDLASCAHSIWVLPALQQADSDIAATSQYTHTHDFQSNREGTSSVGINSSSSR